MIVTTDPIDPEVGDTVIIIGADTTVKTAPLLAIPETVTTTLPVAAPDGTGTTMLVALQKVGVEAVPSKVTVLVP